MTMEFDDGEMEDIAPEYVHQCFEEWKSTLQFLDDWESGLFMVTLADFQAMPFTTQACRRIHKSWIEEQRREVRRKK